MSGTGAVESLPPARPRRTRGTIVLRKSPGAQASRFGIACLALWPDKPGTILAQRAGCTERAANLYISGDREPSYEALMAVLDELRPRKRA
jgi:hypothetical protein